MGFFLKKKIEQKKIKPKKISYSIFHFSFVFAKRRKHTQTKRIGLLTYQDPKAKKKLKRHGCQAI